MQTAIPDHSAYKKWKKDFKIPDGVSKAHVGNDLEAVSKEVAKGDVSAAQKAITKLTKSLDAYLTDLKASQKKSKGGPEDWDKMIERIEDAKGYASATLLMIARVLDSKKLLIAAKDRPAVALKKLLTNAEESVKQLTALKDKKITPDKTVLNMITQYLEGARKLAFSENGKVFELVTEFKPVMGRQLKGQAGLQDVAVALQGFEGSIKNDPVKAAVKIATDTDGLIAKYVASVMAAIGDV